MKSATKQHYSDQRVIHVEDETQLRPTRLTPPHPSHLQLPVSCPATCLTLKRPSHAQPPVSRPTTHLSPKRAVSRPTSLTSNHDSNTCLTLNYSSHPQRPVLHQTTHLTPPTPTTRFTSQPPVSLPNDQFHFKPHVSPPTTRSHAQTGRLTSNHPSHPKLPTSLLPTRLIRPSPSKNHPSHHHPPVSPRHSCCTWTQRSSSLVSRRVSRSDSRRCRDKTHV